MKSKLIQIVIFLVIISLTSCSSSKRNLSYFTDIPLNSASGILGSSNYDIRVVPSDELCITVNSAVPEATAIFNLPLNNPTASATLPNVNNSPSQQTYIVDKNGDIIFPELGKIHVAGLTTNQIADLLTSKISKFVNDPYVRVDLINFKVNVMGAVNSPTVVNVNSERFSIFDALASANDISQYGDRTNVIVIREIDGTKHYQRLNLQDSNITDSPYYYLHQNDVVLVEPNKIIESNSRYNQFSAFKLSVISTIVSTTSVIASLVIALVVK